MQKLMVKVVCERCNGAGGWVGWPDFTCYACHGDGFKLRTQTSVTRRERELAKREAAKTRTDHCVQCDQDVTTSKWFCMKGTELWCGLCFAAFRAAQRATA